MNETPSQLSDATSLTLLGLVRDQDTAAWERMVKLYGPMVFRWAVRTGLSDDHAADVTQDVWLSVSQKFSQFRKDSAHQSFRAWLWTVTRNKVRDYLRQHAESAVAPGGTNHQLRMNDIPEYEPDDDSKVQNSHGLLQRTLDLIKNDFEPQTWAAFWKLTVLGHSAKDVAADLGIAPNAVHQARFRVIKRLRAEIEALGLVHEPSYSSLKIFA